VVSAILYGKPDCQASKGFDKHVMADDADVYYDCGQHVTIDRASPCLRSARLLSAHSEVHGGPKSLKFCMNLSTCISNIYPQYERAEFIFYVESRNFLKFRKGGGKNRV
jgi:hypothetical protein